MKRKLTLLLCITAALIAVFAFATIGASAADNVHIYIEDCEIDQGDQPAFTYNQRTMVPLRAVSENLGMTVQWHPEDQSIVIFDPMNGDTYTYWLGKTDMRIQYSNGYVSNYEFDTAPFATDKNRTVVPIRPVGEMYGRVDWIGYDGESNVYLYANEEHVPALKNVDFSTILSYTDNAASCGQVDLDKDGVDEYFIRTGTCEGDYITYFYKYVNGILENIGQVYSGHSGLEKDAAGNVYLHRAHMNVESADLITIKNGRISTSTYMSEREISDEEYEAHGYTNLGTPVREYSDFMN